MKGTGRGGVARVVFLIVLFKYTLDAMMALEDELHSTVPDEGFFGPDWELLCTQDGFTEILTRLRCSEYALCSRRQWTMPRLFYLLPAEAPTV